MATRCLIASRVVSSVLQSSLNSVTLVATTRVPDAVYDTTRAHFSEKELSDLTLAIAAINAWNRLSIAARLRPGAYQPAAV